MEKREYIRPQDIEKRSFELIEKALRERGCCGLPADTGPVIMRAIHTSADFDYLDNLVFSENVITHALDVLRGGAVIVTDTNMALAGINKAVLKVLGCEAVCFMASPEARKIAAGKGITRAAASVELAMNIAHPVIYAVGNAPTALFSICDYYKEGKFRPELVIGVPVGFVNVVQAKEELVTSGIPYIAAMGRKGGSNIAAAIVNALLYMLVRPQ